MKGKDPVEQNPKRLTLAAVNKALAAAGFNERLYKGAGYHYFCDGNSHFWSDTSVMVTRLNDLPLSEWLAECRSRTSDAKRAWGLEPDQDFPSKD